MLDLYELERLFNNWLKAKKCSFSCELKPRFREFEHYSLMEVEIYKVTDWLNKEVINKVSATGKNMEGLWDTVFDKLFAYFMEIGKYVE